MTNKQCHWKFESTSNLVQTGFKCATQAFKGEFNCNEKGIRILGHIRQHAFAIGYNNNYFNKVLFFF